MSPSPAAEIVAALSRTEAFIADPTMRVSYAEIAAVSGEVSAILDQRGIALDACLALHCDNSVPSAIALLGLMAGARTFVLLPWEEATAKPEHPPIPFCRYRLQAGPRRHAEDAIDLQTADVSILIADNDPRAAKLPAGPARYFLPTSGSTGRAKLVRHRQDRLIPAARTVAARLGLSPSDRVAIPVPIAHMYGFGAAFVPAVLARASIDLQPNANVLRYLARERDFDPTVAYLAPSFGDALVRVRKAPRAYRLTIMAGDRLTGELFDGYEALHGRLVNLYGSTELGAVAAGLPQDPAEIRRNLIGPFLPGVSLCRNPEHAQRNGEEVPGLLRFHHEFGFECYVDANGRELREADGSLPSGDCFRSGDVGRLVGDRLEVLGRADDRVNRDGLLVACADVEAAVRSLPGIGEAVVLAGDMARRGRALIAFCVAAEEGRWEPKSLRRACLEILPPAAVPDQILLLSQLPRLPNGKVDRQELRRRHAAGEKPDDVAT